MTQEYIFVPMQRACAVISENAPVLTSAAYDACLGRDYRPPLAAGDLAFLHRSDPVPHVASRRDFTLGGNAYTLFAVVLYENEEDGREAELDLNHVDAVLGHLLSLAMDGGKEVACPIMDLYDSVGNLLQEKVSKDIRVSQAPCSMASVCLDRSALIMALGLLLPDLLAAGDVELCLFQDSFSSFSLCLRAKGVRVLPFAEALSRALSKGGGFSLDITENGIAFGLPRCETAGHMLYAGTYARDAADCLHAALLLRS